MIYLPRTIRNTDLVLWENKYATLIFTFKKQTQQWKHEGERQSAEQGRRKGSEVERKSENRGKKSHRLTMSMYKLSLKKGCAEMYRD